METYYTYIPTIWVFDRPFPQGSNESLDRGTVSRVNNEILILELTMIVITRHKDTLELYYKNIESEW